MPNNAWRPLLEGSDAANAHTLNEEHAVVNDTIPNNISKLVFYLQILIYTPMSLLRNRSMLGTSAFNDTNRDIKRLICRLWGNYYASRDATKRLFQALVAKGQMGEHLEYLWMETLASGSPSMHFRVCARQVTQL